MMYYLKYGFSQLRPQRSEEGLQKEDNKGYHSKLAKFMEEREEEKNKAITTVKISSEEARRN